MSVEHEFQQNGPGIVGSDICTDCGKEREDHDPREWLIRNAELEATVSALKAELEGARAQLAERGGVAVKALEWAEDRDDDGTEIHRTRGGEVNLTYTIYEDGFIKKPFSVSLNQLRIGSFDTVAEAKAAAQRDFESRILSALAPSERRQVTEADVARACEAYSAANEHVGDGESAVPNSMRAALEAALGGAEGAGWRPMDEAPEHARVIVAGWQRPSGTVAGYWWMHEDNIIDGKPFEHRNATLWHPFPSRPTAAPSPALREEDR